jgi:hypothetical protein
VGVEEIKEARRVGQRLKERSSMMEGSPTKGHSGEGTSTRFEIQIGREL